MIRKLLSKNYFSKNCKDQLKVCIVGGVAGGASCATRLRRLSEDVQIKMFEKGEYISFANCGLPYHIGNVIKDRSKLIIQTVPFMNKRYNIDIANNSEVTKIDRQNKKIEVYNHQTKQTYWEDYDKLVLSPGANPIVPNIPGSSHKNIFTLRNIPDTDKIKGFIDKQNPKHAYVIGGGFIGLEMVEMLQKRDIAVTLVEAAPHIMTPLDPEMAALVQQHLKLRKIQLYLNDGVTKFEENSEGKLVATLASGKQLCPADMCIMSIGVKPDLKLAQDAGLECGRGIKTDTRMLTNDKDIYAIGDAAEVTNIVNHQHVVIPLAGPANKQGRIVADQIMGRKTRYQGSQGTGIAKVFQLGVGSTGLNARQLKQSNIEFLECITHNNNHAGYYPGAISICIKLLFCPNDGLIYGAQIVGKEGVDKRLDVLASAIRNRLTVFDLEQLELSYAPPYGAAKDAVNFNGFVAANIFNGDLKQTMYHEIPQKQKEGAMILDLRTKDEFDHANIEGSVHLDLNVLRQSLDKIPKDREVILVCAAGRRAYMAHRILVGKGFDNTSVLVGGFKTYTFANAEQTNMDLFTAEDLKNGVPNQPHNDDALNSDYIFWGRRKFGKV